MTGLNKKIVLLPGDGIGPEVVRVGVRVLKDCASEFGHHFDFTEFPFGGCAIDRAGMPLPAETLAACRASDAILLGAVGGPKWDVQPPGNRPESGLLALRKELGLYINFRPIHMHPSLRGLSPLNANRAAHVHMEFVRELAGDIYFGEHRVEPINESTEEGRASHARGERALDAPGERASGPHGERASDEAVYTTAEIERVAKYAFARAEARLPDGQARRGRITSVDKANVLATSQLWRKTVTRLAADHPGVKLDHLYVDNAAMQMVLAPEQFDVILTSNLFGDILSDLGAALVGSIGLIPSMSSGTGPSMYEPIHGSAPSLAGKDVANPVGTILSASMMLRESFGLVREAEWIEAAVDRLFSQGVRTTDIAEPGTTTVGCVEFGERLHAEMLAALDHHERYGWGV